MKQWKPRYIHNTKTGQLVLAVPHRASFVGSHNESKAKALITLYSAKYHEHKAGFTLRELTSLSGVDYGYLKSRLSKWVAWQYLTRKIVQGELRPVYQYSLTKRGERFIGYIPTEVAERYWAEIQAYRERRQLYALGYR